MRSLLLALAVLTTSVAVQAAEGGAPSTPSAEAAARSVVGTWAFASTSFSYQHTLNADRTTVSSGSATGTWEITGGKLVVRWRNNWTDTYTLPAVNGVLSGTRVGPAGQTEACTLTAPKNGTTVQH